MSISLIRTRMRADELASTDYTFTETQVTDALNSIQSNGSVLGTNYLTDPRPHTSAMRRIARAYWTPSHSKYLDQNAKTKLINALTYLEGATIGATNWYHQYIQVSYDLSRALLLMDSGTADGLTRIQIQGLNTKVYYYNVVSLIVGANTDDSANRMYFLFCSIAKGVLNNTDSRFTTDFGLVYNELTAKNFLNDGVNADWGYRYHSHTKSWVSGYGTTSFLNLHSKLLPLTYQTVWENIPIIDFYLDAIYNGFLWSQHKRVTDITHMNRAIGDIGNNQMFIGSGNDIDLQNYANRFLVLNYRTSDFQFIKDFALGNVPFTTEGIKYYWISNCLTRKTANSHISISFPNKRQDVVSESFSGSGKTHVWLQFGSYFMLTDGEELFEVQPTWIWSRIPGTTTLDYMPTFEGLLFANTYFAGAANDNQYGVVGYKHDWKQAFGNKFYFVTPIGIFCMGNGIGSSNTTHPLITTVQQNISTTTATIKRATESTLNNTSTTQSDINWVFNGKAGYFFPQNGNITVTNQNQSGTWSSIDDDSSSSTVTKKIFSIRFNHGTNVTNQTYQYGVVQDTTLVAMQNFVNPYVVLRNDSVAQAVKYGANVYGMVFYQSGLVNLEAGVTVAVREACIMLIVFPNGSRESANIYVTDPLGLLNMIEFDISLNLEHEYSTPGLNNSIFRVPTPRQDYACSCVSLICKSPNIETAVGWASVYNEGLGVTGGGGGIVRTYTDPVLMLNDLVASSASTPEIYLYTGSNASIGTGVKTITGKSNKTLICSNGQELRDGEIRFQSCENIIIRNIVRVGLTLPHEDYGGVTRDGFTINSCIGVWIDHIEVNGLGAYGGVSGSTNIYWDGCIDINLSNFITISNSYFRDADRGILIGYSDTEFTNRNLLNVTIINCKFTNIRQRAPRARFGKIHLLNNVFDWSPVWGTSGLNRPGTVRFVQAGNESQIYGQNNWFDNGQNLSGDNDTGNPKLSGLLLEGSYVGTFSSSAITSLRPENVIWRPNTTTNYFIDIPIKTPTEAKSYVEIWAGAKYHLR